MRPIALSSLCVLLASGLGVRASGQTATPPPPPPAKPPAASAPAAAATQADKDRQAKYRVGDRVVVILRAEVESQQHVVDHLQPGFTFTVREVDDHRLRVGGSKSGWVDDQNVVALAKAIQHLNEALKKDPENDDLRFARAMVSQQHGNLGSAISDLSELLRRRPKEVSYWNARGNARQQQEDLQSAIADYNEAIRLDPDQEVAFTNRGNARYRQHDYDGAIADHTAAIKRNGDYAAAYHNRAAARQAKGDYAGALADERKAVQLDPQMVAAHNGMAWLLATAPDAKYRDGPAAVAHARQAVLLSDTREGSLLDTLAAACAESGDFANAVKWQKEALAVAPQNAQSTYRARLKLYESRQPYRQAAAAPK